jgi:hypothetical protein
MVANLATSSHSPRFNYKSPDNNVIFQHLLAAAAISKPPHYKLRRHDGRISVDQLRKKKQRHCDSVAGIPEENTE